MGHDHHHEVKMPDWRMYKVEDAPQLVDVQKRLAVHGLKDPWLRNHVWKFKNIPSPKENFTSIFKFGFKYGFCLALVSASAEWYFKSLEQGEHGKH